MAINRMGQMMKIATKPTPIGEPGESLEQVKQRFALWRAERRPGTHISDAFWAAAVGLVAQHGLRRIALELSIDYGRLKFSLCKSISQFGYLDQIEIRVAHINGTNFLSRTGALDRTLDDQGVESNSR